MSTIIYEKLKRLAGSKAEGLKEIAGKFKLLKSGRGTKYNSMKIEYAGDRYDSLSEAYYSYLLDNMLQKGELTVIQRQVNYRLPDINGGFRYRYCADFVVTGLSGEEYVIDVKGRLTPENKIKYAYFQHYHKKKLHIVDTSGASKFDTSFII